MKPKIITAEEAAQLVKSNQTLLVGGSAGIAVPESILEQLEKRFLETGEPRDLWLVHTTGMGDRQSKGAIHFAHEGMLRRVITAHYGLQPQIAKMARENKFEAYNFPQGPMSQLFREIAAHRPGVLTHVGLGTYMDPRVEGGKMNERTTEDLIEVVNIDGKEWLLYKSFPIDVALLRGTTADEKGNISIEHEAASLELLSQAQATKNSGGIVIVQVRQIASEGSLDPRMVKIPGFLVDYLVVEPEPWMTFQTKFDLSYVGEIRKPLKQSENIGHFPLDVRKLIARRAAMEIKEGQVGNIGAGIADGVPRVATEEGIIDKITFTIESGVIGGTGNRMLDFGTATNPIAIIDQPYMFDFYDGGGLDITFLSFVEVDSKGNTNVSKLSGQIEGPGGFIDISSNAKQVCFLGTFTAGGLEVEIKNGKLQIIKEGRYKKFVDKVSHLTWNAQLARKRNQKVIFITERAVFGLDDEGLVLQEIAPGVDLEKHVLSQIPFKIKVSDNLKLMDERLFREELMGLNRKE